MNLKNKSFLNTQSWNVAELCEVLFLAAQMKRDPLNGRWADALKSKTFLMLFDNASLRTHLSFATAMQQLGGDSIYRTRNMSYAGSERYAGESVRDVAEVMSRYVHGIGIRTMLGAVSRYGAGHQLLEEYANVARVPIINMCDDRFHPCQALADLMGWAEKLGGGIGHPDVENLRGKRLLVTWARSNLPRPWGSVQSHLLVASRFGMHVTLARPDGYDLDQDVYREIRSNCELNQARFDIVSDPDEAYSGAHVVFVRNWISGDAYHGGQFQHEAEIDRASKHIGWTTTVERMRRTDNAVFANPMPLDRGVEATNEVADSSRSVMYEVAENRLHVQKAILALTMSGMGAAHLDG